MVTNTYLTRLMGGCLLLLSGCTAIMAADLSVWTTTDCIRVLRSVAANDAAAVQLQAARNEWESFQILLRAPVPVPGITVSAGDLVGPDNAVLPGNEARLYRQHQLEVSVGSMRNEAFKPDWYPDALIPFRHPLTRAPHTGARLTAVPFDLPAEQTHGFWVDVYVPPSAPPGTYRGTYSVQAPGREARPVPVTLEVWDFSLPRVSTFATAFGSPAERMRAYYKAREEQGHEAAPADWSAVETQCAEMLSRHRINATPPAGSLAPQKDVDGTYRIPPEQIEALREFVDRYHVNAFATPRVTNVVKDPGAERERLHAWLAAWNRAAAELDRPGVTIYTYLKDEPNNEDAYRFVQTWGRAIRAADSVVKVLVVEQTWPQNEAWGDLYGAVDIWCPLFPLFREESAVQRQAVGETIWTYTALAQRSPMTPWWAIDHPLLHYRVPAWISWRYGIRGLLYWGGMSFWRQVDDPWTDPKTLDRRKDPQSTQLYNGEGSIVYPGRAVGYDGIAPSLRLKALRDSIEDYEYMTILERAGLEAEARRVVAPLAGSWFEWNRDPAAFSRARAQLAALIVAAKVAPD